MHLLQLLDAQARANLRSRLCALALCANYATRIFLMATTLHPLERRAHYPSVSQPVLARSEAAHKPGK